MARLWEAVGFSNPMAPFRRRLQGFYLNDPTNNSGYTPWRSWTMTLNVWDSCPRMLADRIGLGIMGKSVHFGVFFTAFYVIIIIFAIFRSAGRGGYLRGYRPPPLLLHLLPQLQQRSTGVPGEPAATRGALNWPRSWGSLDRSGCPGERHRRWFREWQIRWPGASSWVI